jgi:Methyltransferase domain
MLLALTTRISLGFVSLFKLSTLIALLRRSSGLSAAKSTSASRTGKPKVIVHFVPPADASRSEVLRFEGGAIDARRREILDMMPKNSIGAELGVFCGEFSASILGISDPSCLHLVDPWWVAFGEFYPDWGAFTDFGRLRTARAYELTRARVEDASGTGEVHLHAEYSTVWLESVADRYLDWAYLDSTHAYEETLAELHLLKRKVKVDGLIFGDGFYVDPRNSGKHHGVYRDGVYRAIQRFIREQPYDLIYADSNLQWALRRAETKSQGRRPGKAPRPHPSAEASFREATASPKISMASPAMRSSRRTSRQDAPGTRRSRLSVASPGT